MVAVFSAQSPIFVIVFSFVFLIETLAQWHQATEAVSVAQLGSQGSSFKRQGATTDIDKSSMDVLKNMLTYLVDLIGVNEDIMEQLATDQEEMDQIITTEIGAWKKMANIAEVLYQKDKEIYISYESQLNELAVSSLSYEEELNEIEVEIDRVTGDLEKANNNYLTYLKLAEEAKIELGGLMGSVESFLGIENSSKGTFAQGKTTLGESTELLNKMKMSLKKIKSFESLFDKEEAGKLEEASMSLLESTSKSAMKTLYEVVSDILGDMEVTSSVWESYQVQMMMATDTYDKDLGDWNKYINTALQTIAGTEESIKVMVDELKNYMASSEEIKAQCDHILLLLSQYKQSQDEFYQTEFARLNEEIITIQKIYDTFEAEASQNLNQNNESLSQRV